MSPMLPQLRLLCRLRKRWHQTLSYVSLVLLLMTRVMQYCAKVMETIIAISRRYLNDTVLKTLNRSYIWLSHMMSLFMLFMFCVVFFFFSLGMAQEQIAKCLGGLVWPSVKLLNKPTR